MNTVAKDPRRPKELRLLCPHCAGGLLIRVQQGPLYASYLAPHEADIIAMFDQGRSLTQIAQSIFDKVVTPTEATGSKHQSYSVSSKQARLTAVKASIRLLLLRSGRKFDYRKVALRPVSRRMSEKRIEAVLGKLPARIDSMLRNENIRTVGELLKRTERDLLYCPNFGRWSLYTLNELLAKHGLRLAERW